MRTIGLDVHKHFTQVAVLEAGRIVSNQRIETKPWALRKLAAELGPDDQVVLEASVNTWAVADLLRQHAGRVVVSNPLRTRAIASAKVKTDKVDSEVLAQLLAADFIPEVWVPDDATRQLRQLVSRRRSLVQHFPNLVLARTFSKIYGLAGLRLGYGIMRPEVMEPLLRARDPFSVNSLAIAGGVAALDDRDHVAKTLATVREGRKLLYTLFESLAIDYVPSHANFILFHMHRPAEDVYADLLTRRVLIRPCTSFGLPHSLRVTIGTQEQNEAFEQALRAVRHET